MSQTVWAEAEQGALEYCRFSLSSKSVDGSLPLNRAFINEGWMLSVFLLCLFIQGM